MTEIHSADLLDFSLSGKVAIVTGGASGIGAAIVDAYASKGATVVILDRALEAAQRKVSEGRRRPRSPATSPARSRSLTPSKPSPTSSPRSTSWSTAPAWP